MLAASFQQIEQGEAFWRARFDMTVMEIRAVWRGAVCRSHLTSLGCCGSVACPRSNGHFVRYLGVQQPFNLKDLKKESGFERDPGRQLGIIDRGLWWWAPVGKSKISAVACLIRSPLLQSGRYHVACFFLSVSDSAQPPEAGLYESLASLASAWRGGGFPVVSLFPSYCIHVIVT